MNTELIFLFSQLRSEAQAAGEVYREQAFDKTIKILSMMKSPITVDTIPAEIGKNNRERIRQFLSGEVIKPGDIEKDRVLQLFTTIPGVGIKTAARYYDLGYRTIEDVANHETFNYRQSVGIKYYNDLQERIPQSEIKMLEDRLYYLLQVYNYEHETNLTFLIAGSYRRRAETSGDIDVLLVDLTGKASDSINSLIHFLQENQLLYETLSLGKVKYNGIAKILTKFRRLDIEIIDDLGAIPTAIIYFTGNKDFNIRIRELAKEKGWLLNTDGLYVDGVRIPVQNEHDVFTTLGLDYLEPWERK